MSLLVKGLLSLWVAGQKVDLLTFFINSFLNMSLNNSQKEGLVPGLAILCVHACVPTVLYENIISNLGLVFYRDNPPNYLSLASSCVWSREL